MPDNENILRILMIGDVVGEPGLLVLEAQLPQIIAENKADITVVNGENAADGFGLTEAALRRILGSGADVVTSGNHVWEKRDFLPFLDSEERVLRPANYPAGNGNTKTPGHGWIRLNKTSAKNTVVINLQGRELMSPIDCPFRCFDAIAKEVNPENSPDKAVVIVDFHAESTREKEALAYYLDGRASLIAGTHTHVQTADERILPGGAAYITDLGMTGIIDSVIGMDPKICIERVKKQILYRMEPAKNGENEDGQTLRAAVQGIIAEIDLESGKAVSIKRI